MRSRRKLPHAAQRHEALLRASFLACASFALGGTVHGKDRDCGEKVVTSSQPEWLGRERLKQQLLEGYYYYTAFDVEPGEIYSDKMARTVNCVISRIALYHGNGVRVLVQGFEDESDLTRAFNVDRGEHAEDTSVAAREQSLDETIGATQSVGEMRQRRAVADIRGALPDLTVYPYSRGDNAQWGVRGVVMYVGGVPDESHTRVAKDNPRWQVLAVSAGLGVAGLVFVGAGASEFAYADTHHASLPEELEAEYRARGRVLTSVGGLSIAAGTVVLVVEI